MDAVARIETIDEAFRAVQTRNPFALRYLQSMLFFYLPVDRDRAHLIVARANKRPEQPDYEPLLANIGIFVVGAPVGYEFTRDDWHCLAFNLERQTLC